MVNLFFSYSHKDEALRDELDKHLSILKRQGIINVWHDRRINAGSVVDTEISNNLKNANIVLLLVSSDFLASDYCYDKEMQHAMKMHKNKEAVVIPVILRPCDWHSAPFGALLAAPTDGKAVTKFASYDEAFLEITSAIKAVIQAFTLNEKNAVEPKPAVESRSPADIRSSNLRIAKKFSDQDKDLFVDEAFEYVVKYFEGSLEELKTRNKGVDYAFKRLDSQSFSVVIYIDQQTKAQCMIFRGGLGSSTNSISYSNSISSTRNSLNDSLNIQDDQNMLYLAPLMGGMMQRSEGKLTLEGAAEYFWQKLIEPLQRRY
jgi:hypothetical protein